MQRLVCSINTSHKHGQTCLRMLHLVCSIYTSRQHALSHMNQQSCNPKPEKTKLHRHKLCCWHKPELLPLGEVAVYSATELCLGSVPVLGILERDVGGGVVHHCEGAHPEVVAQPGHQPELEEARYAGEVDEGREGYRHEAVDCCQADLDLHPSQAYSGQGDQRRFVSHGTVNMAQAL